MRHARFYEAVAEYEALAALFGGLPLYRRKGATLHSAALVAASHI
jgi:hypothetical protein